MARLGILAAPGVALLVVGSGCGKGDPPLDTVLLSVPEEIVFDEVSVGSTAIAPLPIHNPSPTDVQLTGVEPAFDFTADAYTFTVQAPTGRIASGATVFGRVTFLPRVTLSGPAVSSFLITTNARPVKVRVRGRTLAPALRFEPERLDFGVVALGGTEERSVRVTNLLDQPAVLTVPLDARGEPALDHLSGAGRFELDGTATEQGTLHGGQALLPGESIELPLRYHRSRDAAATADRALLALSACDRPQCTASLAISASDEATAISCSAEELDFGAVRPGAVRTLEIDCTNRIASPIEIHAALAAGSATSFQLNFAEALALSPGDHVQVVVGFAPDDASLGASSAGVLTIDSGSGGDAFFLPVSIPLAGEASRAGIRTAPAEIAFGRIAVVTRGRRALSIANDGSSPLRVRLEVAAPFALEDAGPLELPAGGTAEISVLFEPASIGPASADLALVTNDPDHPMIAVRLNGEGIDLPPCDHRAEPSVDFGAIERPRVGRRVLEIENAGMSPCLFKDFVASAPFRVVSEPEEQLVAPGGKLRIEVEVEPAADGPIAGRLAFYASSPGDAPALELRAEGRTLGLIASPATLDFGAVSGCPSAERSLDLFNGGTEPLELERLDVIGTPDFAAALGAELILEPGARRTIQVQHRGESAGLARLEVRVRDGFAPSVVDLIAASSTLTEERSVVPRSADVLFVIDADAAVPQLELASLFDAFIAPARAEGVDWQAGIITTDSLANGCEGPPSGLPETSTTTGACGFLADRGVPERRLIDAATAPSPAEAFAALAMVGVGFDPPAALAAAYHALSNPILTSWNQGLVRPDAALIVVFVSAEDDASLESVDHWRAYLRSLKRDQNALAVAAITAGQGCPTSNAPRYRELVDGTGGSMTSICADLEGGLALLGELLAGRTTMILEGRPDPTTIEVRVGGAPVDPGYFAFDPATNAVTLSPLVRPGTGGEVIVRYRPLCL